LEVHHESQISLAHQPQPQHRAARKSVPVMQREVDRLFEDFTRGFPSFPTSPAFQTRGAVDLMPSMDLTETDKEIEITAELPGLEEKDDQPFRQPAHHPR
jgi:HSP20 family protein